MAGKKDKKSKAEEPADKPAEGEDGAPVKKKMAGKTLVLFIILPAILVLGGGGAAAAILLGGKKTEVAEADAGGEHGADKAKEKKPEKKEKKEAGGHGAPPAEGKEGEGAETETADVGHALECAEGDPCYYAMPTLLVNLSAADGQRPATMKLDLVLEAGDTHAFEAVPKSMPRLMDQFTTFLRELHVEDLDGTAGTFRLRQELLRRFNLVMAPAQIDAVLVEGILIQ